MNNPLDFFEKKILISGASSGMGAETAKLLSLLGAEVCLIARREEKLYEVLETLTGKGHKCFSADLGQIDTIEPLMEEVHNKFGRLDGFVNCTGIGDVRPLRQSNYDFMLKVLNVNFFSFVEQVRCLLKRGYVNEGFNIVAISSCSAVQGSKAGTAYAASKAAIDGAIRCMAKELAPKGIRVNSVMPGVIDTRIAKEALELWPGNEFMMKQVMGMGEPLDVANAIAFLLSDMARLITGTALRVDGGSLA